VLSTLNHP